MLQYCRRRFFNLFDRTWLRSGPDNHAYNSRYLTASGAYYSTYDARRFSVRPALYNNRVLLYPKSTLTFGRIN